MKEMIEKLPAPDFIRVHRSYILPFGSIESVKGTEITIGDSVFPIGKTFVEEFFKRYSK
jgi:DNA-binding LytR/AlgR family response regulator